MLKRYQHIILTVVLSMFSSFAYAGEMETWVSFKTTDEVFNSMKKDNTIQNHNRIEAAFLKPFPQTPNSTRQYAQPVDRINSNLSRSFMEPIIPKIDNWKYSVENFKHREMQESIIRSVPDPSNVYAQRKLENDALKGLNTMISVGSATLGSPLSIASAANNVIRMFGPQNPTFQDISGHVSNGLYVAGTTDNIVSNNYTGAVIGIMNKVIGDIAGNQKKSLMAPVSFSDVKQYHYKIDDGFSRTQGSGTVSVTKIYTPPQTLKPFVTPAIFQGTTTTRIVTSGVKTEHVEYMNNRINTNNYIAPIPRYDVPRYDNYRNYVPQSFTTPTHNFYTPGFTRWK